MHRWLFGDQVVVFLIQTFHFETRVGSTIDLNTTICWISCPSLRKKAEVTAGTELASCPLMVDLEPELIRESQRRRGASVEAVDEVIGVSS